MVLRLPAMTRRLDDLSLWLDSSRILAAYRWFVVACTAVTIVVTWPLWLVRETPPMLPVIPLPAIDMGVPLMVALGLILLRPRIGTGLFTLLLIYAMMCDQIRLQPQFMSFTLLLWGTLPNTNAQTVARAHLISLWCWAGINKFLSPTFLATTGPGLMTSLLPGAPSWLLENGGYLIAASEFSIGLLAIFPRMRLFSALLAFGVHINIFVVLSPLRRDWNESVWYWNLALALAGFVMIAPWKDPPLRVFARVHWLTCVIAALLLIMPLGFYFGVVDAYMAHNLYSSNVPRASKLPPTWSLFDVPFPPEHRLFEQNFQLTCRRGETLRITDQRWWYRRRGMAVRIIRCDAGSG